MKLPWIFASLGLAAAALAPGASADEMNAWPIYVSRTQPADPTPTWSALGPFLFSHPNPDGGQVAGFRPFYVRSTDPHGETAEATVLYPLFYYRRYGVTYEWSVFKLINRVGRVGGAPRAEQAEVPASDRNFSIWPFYFSHQSPYPGESYRGLLPIYGHVQGLLGYGQLSWTLFPLYVQTEKKGSTTTSVPWPIVRFTRGVEHGFAVWPVFGRKEGPHGESLNFFLWPLVWDNTLPPGPDAPPGTGPLRETGILPFYASERRPGSAGETWLWPFFGYTDRTEPDRYHEERFFWPFLVQGRGDKGRLVNRWGPFYSHSVDRGLDSTWVLWPFWHRSTWTDGDTAMTRTQFFYFLASSLEQRSVSRPAAPPALKRQVWPVASSWDNGAGRAQLEIASPFEPLFADNPETREAWSPLFSIIRHDQSAPGASRTSLLWNAVTWSRSGAGRLAEFHLGPILALRRTDGGSWHVSWFDL